MNISISRQSYINRKRDENGTNTGKFWMKTGSCGKEQKKSSPQSKVETEQDYFCSFSTLTALHHPLPVPRSISYVLMVIDDKWACLVSHSVRSGIST